MTVAKRVATFWGNLSISKKMVTVMLCAVLLVAFLLTFIYYQLAADISREHTDSNIVSTLNQAAVNLDLKIDAIETMLYNLSTDAELQNILTRFNRNQLDSEYDVWEQSNAMKSILVAESLKESYVSGVYVYDITGNQFAMTNYVYSYEASAGQIDLTELDAAKGSTVWFDLTEIPSRYESFESYKAIPAGKVIYNSATQQTVGYVVVFVNTECFLDCVRGVPFYSDDVVFLRDRGGNIIADGLVNADDVKSAPSELNRIMNCQYNGEERYIADWQGASEVLTITLITRNSNQSSELIYLQRLTILLLTLTGVCSVTLIILVARGISRPILALTEDMQKFSGGNFTVQVSAKYNDEVGILRKTFNKLVTDIRDLIDNVYKERMLQQQAQLKMLQMQINPHFLYNTLDTINWLAIVHGDEDISEVSRSLANLMRFSLIDRELIPLEEELDALEHYLLIQKYRYGDSLKVDYDVSEESIYERIPPHVLLPIVENALNHGLKDQEGEKRISISSSILDGELRIRITDNGCGMSAQKLDMLTQSIAKGEELHNETRTSIGFANLNQRLILRYGSGAALQITSTEGSGTSVEFRIACDRNEENYELDKEVDTYELGSQ